MGNIAHTKTKKGGKTIINVNKNDEADAQKAMKNDPKYILGKTRVQPYKEEVKRDEYGDPVGGPKISKKKKANNLSSNTPDEQHTTTTSEGYIDLPLEVEIPNTDGKFRLGLMFRESLEVDKGMLFIFEEVGQHSFHMRNTRIPLDIAFIKEDGTIESIKELKPYSSIPVYSDGEVLFAIEANRGWFTENNVEVGDEIVLGEAKDKKGKGSGTKDACYHKVKSRYSVWPSAYASGALVKCRKVGAANWGNKSEEVEVVNEVSKKTLGNYIKKASTDLATRSIKHGMSGGTETGGDPDSSENVEKINKRHSGIMKAADKLKKEAVEYTGPKKGDLKGYGSKAFKEYEKNMDPKKRQALKDKATKGMKFTHEGMSYGLYKGSGKAGGAMKDYLDKKAKMLTKKRNKQSDAAKNNPHFDSTQPSPSGRNKYEEVSFQQFQEKCWAGYEKKGMKTMFGKRYPNCVKKKK